MPSCAGEGRSAYPQTLRSSWWSWDDTDSGRAPRWLSACRSRLLVPRVAAGILRCGERTIGLAYVSSGLRSLLPEAHTVGDKDPDYVSFPDTLADGAGLKCMAIFRDPRDGVRSSIELSRTVWIGWPLATETDTPGKVAAHWARAIEAQKQTRTGFCRSATRGW